MSMLEHYTWKVHIGVDTVIKSYQWLK